MILFAHHAEPEHYPVLAIFLAVGFWLGWHVVSLVINLLSTPKQAVAPPSS